MNLNTAIRTVNHAKGKGVGKTELSACAMSAVGGGRPTSSPLSSRSPRGLRYIPTSVSRFRQFRISSLALVLLTLPLLPTATSTASAAASARSSEDFPARFAHPPSQGRILKIIHGWPDAPEAQDNLIRQLARQGFGGVVCNVSFDQYLESEPHWLAFERAVREARKAGFSLWLYDERGYPSGNAGGLVLRDHPEWEARGLLIVDTETGGGPVVLEMPPGKPVLAAAFPLGDGRIDLARRTELPSHVSEGKLRWNAPAGKWWVLAITENRLYEGTHADGNLWQKLPYVNLLQPEPTQRFLDVTHLRYAARFGGDLGKAFVATFTDEPSLMSCFLKPMPYRPLPWAPNLPVEFKQRRGYALDTALLPALIANAGPRGERFRHDFWLTIGELVSQNFFGQIQERCRQWNIPSGGHLLMEEGLTAHVPLYGDFFRCIRRLDAPSIDCLTSLPPEVPWFIARLLASAAELEGRTLVMSETSDHGQVWRPAGDTRPKRIVSEAEIRGTCNRLFVSGVNTITSYYSFTDLDDAALRRLNEWVGRCATLLTGGHQVADIAMLYPAESLWTKFAPARLWAKDSPGATRIENTYRAAAESLFAAQRDFTFVDSRAITEAKVKSGSLVHGHLRWRVVILPAVDTLPMEAWKNLDRFIQDGGVAIGLGTLPLNSSVEFPSPRVQSLGRRWFGESLTEPQVRAHRSGGAGIFLPEGSEGLLPMLLDGVLEPGVKVHASGSPLRAAHRRIEGREVFFLINDSPNRWQGEVSLCTEGVGERWDLETGARVDSGLEARVTVDLEPYGATALRYPGTRPTRRYPAKSGALPNLVQQSTPLVTPVVARGEFVREELAPDPVHAHSDLPAWQVAAVLTKSKVDTWLFLRFPQSQWLDLTDVDCLILDTWVPEGQKTVSELLVMVQEKDGGDFLANSGRQLGTPGHGRVFVPLNRLQLAGWSKDADGVLDLKRVAEIRVGWGGYFGTEGERVVFSAALPQLGKVRPRVR